MIVRRDGDLERAILYFFIYCPLGTICPLIGQYLSSIGFSGTQVGLVTSLGTGTAIFAGLFWGRVYVNSKRKRIILMSMCIAAAAFGIISTTTTVFALYAIIYCAMYFFQGPLHSLADAFVLDKSKRFSAIRAVGAGGYAIAVFIAGKYAQSHGLENIFYIYGAAFLIAAALFMRQTEPASYKKEDEKIGIAVLFKDKNFIKLLLCAFFFMGTNVSNSTYFGYLFREQGGSVAGIGLAFLLMAGSEAPFMALTPELSKKFGSEKIILAAMIIAVARFWFYSTGPGYTMLLATFFLQGITNGILLVEFVRYFGRIVEPKLSGISISVYYAVGNSLSVIVCSLISGVILDLAGACAVYRFFAVYNMIAVLLYIGLKMYKPIQPHV